MGKALAYPDESDDPMWYMQLSLDCRDAVLLIVGEARLSDRRRREIVYNLSKLADGLLSEVTDKELRAALQATEMLARIVRRPKERAWE